MPKLLNRPELIEGDLAPSCPACHGTDLQTIGPVPEAFHFCSFYYRHPVNRSILVECRSCDFHFRNPCLSREVLDDLYRQQPATVWGSTAEGRQDLAEIVAFMKQLDGSEKNVLDVGCYTGGLLVALRKACEPGKTMGCYGIEPSQLAAAQATAQGVEIIGASIESLNTTARRFDIILLTDVFEHILHSAEFLKNLGRFLQPSGYLIIMTGAYDSEPFSRYKNVFHYCSTPEHVGFMSHRHAQWLAGSLDTKLLKYLILSHIRHSSKVKKSLKTLLYLGTRLIPTAWLSVDNSQANKIAWLRGLGVQNYSRKPDHAFVVFGPSDIAP